MMVKTAISKKAKKIKMLALDIDGVLTDGRIIYDGQGNELKCFNVLDGMGLALLRPTGIKVAMITAKGSAAVRRRAEDIGAVEILENILDKGKGLEQIRKKYRMERSEICYIGDDIVDLPALRISGLAVAVPNACAEVKKAADLITSKEGGKGAVREIIEMILKEQGLWKKVTKRFTG